jgi:hypothetical protein
LDIERLRKLVRCVLVVLVVLASLGVAGLGIAGLVGWVRVGILLALGLGCLRALPGGSRAAGWLFAVWVGLSLILVGTEGEVTARLALDRAQLALGGGAAFLGLASLGLWGCTRDLRE